MLDLLRRLFVPPIFEDEEKTRVSRITNTFGWAAFIVVLILFILRIHLGELSISTSIFFPLVLIVLFLAQIFNRYGHSRLASLFMVVVIWAALTMQASNSDGLRDVSILAYFTVILLAALLLGWRLGLIMELLGILMIWIFAYQEQVGSRTYTIDAPLSYARDLSAILIITSVLIYILVRSLNQSLSDSRLELRERLHVDEELQLQARYLSALHETTFGMLNRLELRPLLESILNHMGELLETAHVGIDLVTADESALQQEMGNGVFAEWNGIHTKKGEGLTGKVWKQGETILVENYKTWAGRNPDAVEIGFQSVAGTPLKSGNKIFGVLIVATIEQELKFTFEQVALLERFAALASLAIDNAHLYEDAQREILERKKVENDLRATEERFHKVFNNSNIAISMVTLEEGTFLDANEAFWGITGLSPEKALGHSTLEFNFWKHPNERKKFVRDLLENGSLKDVEVKFPGDGSQVRSALAYYELITIKNQLCILCMFYDVSEQRQAQRELGESEERFRKVFQSSPVAISISTLEDGRLLDANDAYWEITGCDRQPFLDSQTVELCVWLSEQARFQFVEEIKRKRSILDPEYVIHNRKTGEKRYAIALAELIELRGQSCLLFMLYDITDQKLAENALKSTEARTRAIIASIPDMIFEVSKEGIFLDFMASASLDLIMKPEKYIGENLRNLFPPDISQQAMFSLERALATGQVHAFEYGLPNGDGVQYFEARVASVTSESAIFMVRDISQRRWVETEREKLIRELESKNAESETLRESMAIMVETLDESRTINLILEQLERVIPYDSASIQLLRDDMLEIVSTRGLEPRENYIGLKFIMDADEPSRPLFFEQTPYILLENTQTSSLGFGKPLHRKIRGWLAIPLKVKGKIIGVITLDGNRPGQFSQKHAELALTYANQVAIALENSRLFSELQMELAERKRLIEELEGKNAELERFTYTVSHDLKSPIITIRGFLGFLEQDSMNGNLPRLRGDIKRISDAADKMQTLLNELLELSRVGRLVNPPTMVPFNDIVFEAFDLVQGRLQANLVRVHIQEGMSAVYVDRQRVVEAVQNLLDNAAKFISSDPRIEIGQDGEENGMPIFFISDNGIGIDPVHHERIFGLFNKLEAESDGTGVGLALVKRIIEIHRGRIWVQSEPHKGSTFFFTLPSARPES